MEIQKRQYIVSLSAINHAPIELIGKLATDIEVLQLLSINTPIGFIVTSHAFDDFLIGNDLFDYISPRINDIDYSDEKTIKKASDEIRHAIMNGVFPELVSTPILQSYSNLSGFYDAFVSIHQSPVNEALDEAAYLAEAKVFTNISGPDRLLERIKESWAEIFTPEALKYRVQQSYEGYISKAVVIQRMLQAEINGKMYSYSHYDSNNDVVDVEAFFGLSDPKLWTDLMPDIYTVDKHSQEITEKRISAQEYMFVRKGRTNDKNPIIKIPISKLWYKKQKLDDKFILMVYRYCELLEENFKKPIEASWEFEAGKMYLIDLDIKHATNVVESEDSIKKDKVVPLINKKEENKTPKKSIDEYVKEVKTSATGGQVTVDVQPIEELHILAQGKGRGEKIVFGLVHLIFTENDLAGLTGDEILVVRNVKPSFIKIFNSVKGLIIQDDIDSSNLLEINVPIISGVEDAFDILQENDVVTIYPQSACIYQGAGKESSDKSVLSKIAEPVEAEVKNEPSVEPKQTKLPSPESPVVETHEHKNKDENLPRTMTDFWQILRPDVDNTIVSKGTDGYVLYVADLITSFDKKIFSAELSSRLIKILNHIDRKPLILVSAAQGKLLEEVVEAELDAIDILRNKDALRNLWYCFNNIVDVEDLVKLKKLFTAKGFRRTASFKILVSIHSPQSLIILNGLLDTSVDGVILDLDLMYDEHSITSKHNDEHIVNYLSEKISAITEAKSISIVLALDYKLDKSLLKPFVKAGLNALAVKEDEIAILKPVVAELESELKVEKQKKRGRHRKIIDFGF